MVFYAQSASLSKEIYSPTYSLTLKIGIHNPTSRSVPFKSFPGNESDGADTKRFKTRKIITAESLDKHGVPFTTRLRAELLIPRFVILQTLPSGRPGCDSVVNNQFVDTVVGYVISALVKVPSEPFDRAVGCFVTH